MTYNKKKDTIKQIKIEADKCIGCRACELACAAFHSRPAYSSVNPARSRIRVMIDELKDAYIPVRSGHYTSSECKGRTTYVVDTKEYRECGFCKAVCPSRNYFKDPASGVPLICDMCESDPPQEIPWCVKVCASDALSVFEQEIEPPVNRKESDELTVELEALADKHGMEKVINLVARMWQTAN